MDFTMLTDGPFGVFILWCLLPKVVVLVDSDWENEQFNLILELLTIDVYF